MADRPRRIQPTRATRCTTTYIDLPIVIDDEQDDDSPEHLPRIVPFKNIKEAIKGGLAKPANEILDDSICRIVGRVVADPDFFVVSDGKSQYAVKLEDILKHVPREQLEWYENNIYLYQKTLANRLSTTSSLHQQTPENALGKYTQAIWVLPLVCSSCNKGSPRTLAASEQAPREPTSDYTKPAATMEQDIGQVETDESESSDDDWHRPQKKRSNEEYTKRLRELEERCSKAEDRAFARSNKSLENDKRRIDSLERTVAGLQADLEVYREQNSRHQRKNTILEAQVWALKNANGVGKDNEIDPEETEDESIELRKKLIQRLKRGNMQAPDGTSQDIVLK